MTYIHNKVTIEDIKHDFDEARFELNKEVGDSKPKELDKSPKEVKDNNKKAKVFLPLANQMM